MPSEQEQLEQLQQATERLRARRETTEAEEQQVTEMALKLFSEAAVDPLKLKALRRASLALRVIEQPPKK